MENCGNIRNANMIHERESFYCQPPSKEMICPVR